MKNKKVMSVAIEPTLEQQLTECTKKRDVSKSAFVGLLISKAIKLPIEEEPWLVVGKPANEDLVPVVLKIPVKLKEDKDALKVWLDTQTAGILNKLTTN